MECQKVKIGNIEYAYYELPNPGKPKMLLLHGMLVESHCFAKLAPLLQADYHVIMLDLKGHGKSGRGQSYDSDYTNDAIAKDLHAFYEQVIREPFYIAGYSLGGQYTMKFAGTYPQLLKGVFIIDSAPALSLKGIFKILWLLFTTPKVFKNAEHVRSFYDKKSALGFGDYMLQHCVTADAQGRYTVTYDKKNLAPDTGAKSKVRTADLWAATKNITAPTLILRAGDSFVLNDKLQAQMQANIRNSEVKFFPGLGHNLVFSNPADVAAAMRDFIARKTA